MTQPLCFCVGLFIQSIFVSKVINCRRRSLTGPESSVFTCVCVCLRVNAAALRQHWSIPHYMMFIVPSIFCLSQAGTGCNSAAIQRGACFQIKNSWPSHENQGIPHMQIHSSVFFISSLSSIVSKLFLM